MAQRADLACPASLTRHPSSSGLYTAIGSIEPDRRRNLVELLLPAMPRISEILGGREEAGGFLADLLAYLDNPHTCTYTQLWLIRGMAPSG